MRFIKEKWKIRKEYTRQTITPKVKGEKEMVKRKKRNMEVWKGTQTKLRKNCGGKKLDERSE